MSPASYLTAPPRDAAFMIAPLRGPVSLAAWSHFGCRSSCCSWRSLRVSPTSSSADCRLWRLVKRTGDAFGGETARISRATAQIEGHLAEASAAAVRLKEASARLADARARLDLQLAAVREARADVRRALWFVPGL